MPDIEYCDYKDHIWRSDGHYWDICIKCGKKEPLVFCSW